MVLTNNITPTPTSTPDTEHDTPPHTQPFRPFSLSSNGTFSKSHHRQQPRPYSPAPTYRECLKNHAANIGGHALDGCGEFMPSPTATATHTDPTSLTCAACGCHRNFHRREATDEYSPSIPPSMMTPHFIDFSHPRRSSSSPSPPSPPPPPPPPQPQTILTYPPPPQMFLAISSAAQDDQQVPNHQFRAATRDAKVADEPKRDGRKRFRTKFSQEQKEKMHSFAERLGWKMQRCDQAVVEGFCNEIGVAKGVLKVWMHNNKSNLGNKKDGNSSPAMTAAINGDGDINNNINHGINGYSINNKYGDDDDDDNVNNKSGGDHDTGNGNRSSSST